MTAEQGKCDLPVVGMRLRDKHSEHGFTATVTDVYPGSGYHGMTLEWVGYNVHTDAIGRRGQGFTTRDWRTRWEVQDD